MAPSPNSRITSAGKGGVSVSAFGLPIPSASWFEEEKPQSNANMAPSRSRDDIYVEGDGDNCVSSQQGNPSDGFALIKELHDVLGGSYARQSDPHVMSSRAKVRVDGTAPNLSEAKHDHEVVERKQLATENFDHEIQQQIEEHPSKRRTSSKSFTALSVKKQSFRFSGKSIRKALSTTFLSKFVGSSSKSTTSEQRNVAKQGKSASTPSIRGVIKRSSIRSSKHGLSMKVEQATPPIENINSATKPQVTKENSREEEVHTQSSMPGELPLYSKPEQIVSLVENSDSLIPERSDHLSVHEEEDDDEEDLDEKEDFHETETWFGSNSLKKEKQMIEEDRQKADDAFYQKLKRAQSSQKSPQRLTKRLPSEAYGTQTYDYGMPSARRVGMNRATSLHSIDKTASASQSYDDDSTVASSHSVGITRPKPVETDVRGNFILPTVVVGKSLFRGEQREHYDVSSPGSHRKPKATSPTSIVASPNGAFSPMAGSRVPMSSLPRSPSGHSRSVKSTENLARPPSLPYADDEISVGSNASGYTHYSRDSLGSVGSRHSATSNVGRPRNVARMIHNSVEHSGQVQSAQFGNIAPAIPAYVMALEQKVHDLEEKLEALDQESHSSSVQLRDPSLSCLFVLLLEPVQRKFELVQVSSYLLKDTVGDLLRQVYQHATVPLLANQTYRGFCRPKDGIEMVLTESPIGKVPGGWRVVEGEILVGIPQNSTGQDCALMSQPILQNPKVVRLLRRKKPMSTVSRTSSSRRRRSSASAPRNQITGQVIDDIDSEVQRSLARLLLGQSTRNLVAVHEE